MDIYVVKADETINDIAKRFNLTIDDIQSVNDINVLEIKEGDEINIPLILSEDFIYYEVKEGDTLKNIVAGKNLDLKTIAHLNGLELSDYIYPKQVLIIPKDNVRVYITEKGDTLKDLEANLGFTIQKILEDNPNLYLVENQLIIERDSL